MTPSLPAFSEPLRTPRGTDRSATDGMSTTRSYVGLPASRRLALSFASLQVATERYISEELASALCGCWVTALLFRRCLMCAIGPLFGLAKREPSTGGSRLRHLGPRARQDLVMLAALAPLLASNVAVPTSNVIGCSDASLARGLSV